MENSLFETFSDKQMIKYMKYASPILGQLSLNLEVFLDEIYGQSEKQLAAPIGGSLSRLDKEYLFYVFSKNDDFNTENINRPKLNEMDIQFIVKERQISYTTHSGTLLTYVSDDVDQSYLYGLKNNDEIDPWDWDSNTEYGDSDYIDDEWDY
jgi:hypothetical protein